MSLNPNLTQLYPHVWRLIAPNPSVMTGPGTNTYLVGGEQLIIIDPGPADATHLDNTVAAVDSLGGTVQAVIPTHFHADHSGNAQVVAQRLNAPLLSFNDPFQAEEEIKVDGATLVVKHTPGHIQAHICLWLQEQNLLFGADLVAGEGTIVIIPPDGDMADYLASLRAMKALAPAAILPGHGPVIEDPQAWLQQYIDHRLQREAQVVAMWGRGYHTAAEIAAHIYTDQPPPVLRIATLQVEAHLEKLRQEKRLPLRQADTS